MLMFCMLNLHILNTCLKSEREFVDYIKNIMTMIYNYWKNEITLSTLK
jgi:hypothetical protein